MTQREVFPALIEDIKERDRKGWEEYGGPLLTDNGRKPIREAYEEVLDLAVYLKQYLMEEEDKMVFFDQRDQSVGVRIQDRGGDRLRTALARISRLANQGAELFAASAPTELLFRTIETLSLEALAEKDP